MLEAETGIPVLSFSDSETFVTIVPSVDPLMPRERERERDMGRIDEEEIQTGNQGVK
jgi:hypothetical protein